MLLLLTFLPPLEGLFCGATLTPAGPEGKHTDALCPEEPQCHPCCLQKLVGFWQQHHRQNPQCQFLVLSGKTPRLLMEAAGMCDLQHRPELRRFEGQSVYWTANCDREHNNIVEHGVSRTTVTHHMYSLTPSVSQRLCKWKAGVFRGSCFI